MGIDDIVGDEELQVLWNKAREIFFEQIGEAKAERIVDSATLKDTISDLKKASDKATTQYGTHTVKTPSGKPLIEVKLGNVMKRLDLLLQMGDSAMQYAPETVSIVWTAFRMIFAGFLEDVNLCEFLTDATDKISEILFVCEIYAVHHLKAKKVGELSPIGEDVLNQIPDVYAVILKFAYFTRRVFSHKTKIGRTLSNATGKGAEMRDALAEAQDKRDKLSRTDNILLRETTLSILEEVQISSEKLDELRKTTNDLFESMMKEVLPTIKATQADVSKVREIQESKEVRNKFRAEFSYLRKKPIAELDAPGLLMNTNIVEKRHKGTCQWIFKLDPFTEWLAAKEKRILWLHGEGGFGKSVLMSTIVEHLQNDLEVQQRKPIIIWFFCKLGVEGTQKGSLVLLHLICQLFQELDAGNIVAGDEGSKETDELRKRFTEAVKDMRARIKDNSQKDSVYFPIKSALLPLLEEVVRGLEREVILVVDGLDECVDAHDGGLIDALLSVAQRPGPMRVLVSSRPKVELQETLELAKKTLYTVEVDQTKTKKDIHIYVSDSLKTIRRWDGEQRKRASRKIADKSEGMFRYATIVVEQLKQYDAKRRSFKQTMEELPSGMSNLYRQTMQALPPSDRDMLLVALRWCMTAKGTVEIMPVADELEHVYEQDLSDSEGEEDEGADKASDYESDDDSNSGKESDDEDEKGTDNTSQTSEMNSEAAVDAADTTGEDYTETIKDLERVGRDFLKWNGDVIELQHNSVRDFIHEDEKLVHKATIRCADCVKRFGQTSTYQAGEKNGNLLMIENIFRKLNSKSFQRKFLYIEGFDGMVEENLKETIEEPEVEGEDKKDGDWEDVDGEADAEAGAEEEEDDDADKDEGNSAENAGSEEADGSNEATQPEDDQTKPVNGVVDGARVLPTDSEETQSNGKLDDHTQLPIIGGQSQAPEYVAIKDADSAAEAVDGKQQDDGITPEDQDADNANNEAAEAENAQEEGNAEGQADEANNEGEEGVDDQPAGEPAEEVENPDGLIGWGIVEGHSRYELSYWHAHLRDAELAWPQDEREPERERWEKLYKAAEKFLNFKSLAYQCWLKRTSPWSIYSQYSRPTHVAAYYGLVGLLERYDKAGEDLDLMTNRGTPLHFCCWGTGGFAGLDLLLARCKDINAKNEDQGQTPLLTTMWADAGVDLVQKFLDKGAKVNIQDAYGQTCLHIAASRYNIEVCRLLLTREEININEKDENGETPLHWAFRARETPTNLAELLIAEGADVNMEDNASQRPLYEACNVGNAEGARVLLKHGADVNDGEDVLGYTAMHVSVYVSSLDCVKVLVEYKADLTIENKANRHPLAQAADEHETDILMYLLDVYKEKLSRDEITTLLLKHDVTGYTPLHNCAFYTITEAAEKILDMADAEKLLAEKLDNGSTPLHVAADTGSEKMTRMMLDKKADPLVLSEWLGQQWTPFSAAFIGWYNGDHPTADYEAAIEALAEVTPKEYWKLKDFHVAIEKGSDRICRQMLHLAKEKDDYAWTPLMIALQHQQHEIVRLLSPYDDQDLVARYMRRDEMAIGSFPTRFSATDKDPNLHISEDGLEVWTEPLEDNPRTSVRCNYPVPLGLSTFYYEIKILEQNDPETAIVGLGFASSFAHLDEMPGWENAKAPTYGYHGDDGNIFGMSNSGKEFGPTYGVGDTVGCGIDFRSNSIYYTHNGKFVGVAFENVKGRFFPIVGMGSGNKVRLTIYQHPTTPFVYKDWQKGSTVPSTVTSPV